MTTTAANAEEKTSDNQFKGFKIPTVDTSAILDSYKKNLEIFGTINKMSMEVCSGIAKLQSTFIKQMITDVSSIIEKGGKPTDVIVKFSDMTRNNIEKAIENNKQISEMIATANKDITTATTKRFKESIEEAKNIVNKK